MCIIQGDECIVKKSLKGYCRMDGVCGVRGSHHVYVDPTKKGHIVVTHPRKDMPIGLLKAIFKQAGLTGEVK
jgi:predicted RNA binding protein YcfA (HicA-like mRNA interferase family)